MMTREYPIWWISSCISWTMKNQWLIKYMHQILSHWITSKLQKYASLKYTSIRTVSSICTGSVLWKFLGDACSLHIFSPEIEQKPDHLTQNYSALCNWCAAKYPCQVPLHQVVCVRVILPTSQFAYTEVDSPTWSIKVFCWQWSSYINTNVGVRLINDASNNFKLYNINLLITAKLLEVVLPDNDNSLTLCAVT